MTGWRAALVTLVCLLALAAPVIYLILTVIETLKGARRGPNASNHPKSRPFDQD
jgi:hypothetical protein